MKYEAPLYRRVNTRTRGVRHDHGGDYRHQRNTKRERAPYQTRRGSMVRGVRRGLDYTPLFRFLLSKVGARWDDVYSEAKRRLDRTEPIFWMVALRENERMEYVQIGATSYYSGLYVDDDGTLRIVNPEIGPHSIGPSCECCTHTFNGKRFTREFEYSAIGSVRRPPSD